MSTAVKPKMTPTATHWGTYWVEVEDDKVVALHDYEGDPAPSIIGPGIIDSVEHKARIGRPMFRKGWLEKREKSDRSARGTEPFVAVPWDEALEITAEELSRIKQVHGNKSIYAGSYGWASAGRVHHANSHIHRFFNMFGGYVGHVGTYSYAAGEFITNRVLGPARYLIQQSTSFDVLAEHCELFLMFGGLPVKNAQINQGGVGKHMLFHGLQACADNGCELVSISPIRIDTQPTVNAEWIAPRPGSDAALMLALAYVLIDEQLYDKAFVAKYTVGFERFRAYVMGEAEDGVKKTPAWAEEITTVSASTIASLARRMASKRTMINCTWSMQRAEFGEQPVWLAYVLGSLIGQVGLPGGGFAFGYSSENYIGNPGRLFKWAAIPQGINAVEDFIPVARISDALLNPGGAYQFDGQDRTYPDIRLLAWAGGNPFHHHQDLHRLVEALRQPETIMVNEIWWTSMARHADIVFPSTTTLERNDFGAGVRESVVTAMHQAVPRYQESRADYEIFSGLADKLGFGDKYTEGRDEFGWMRHLWDISRQQAAKSGFELPDFETFWEQGVVEIPREDKPHILLEDFRNDPDKFPLRTPSGKIEIFSETIESFGYDDCPGHPVWREPTEWLGSEKTKTYPLHLISNQPKTKLHSQLDMGQVSAGAKIDGREALTLHPEDAAARGLSDGEIVRVFNDRGSCLAGVIVSDVVKQGVVQMATGSWYDPSNAGQTSGLEKHGNPNVLTRDVGTSRLGQGPTAHSTLVEIEKYTGELPPVTAFNPPEIMTRDQ